MAEQTRAARNAAVTSDILTGSAGNVTAAKVRTKLTNWSDSMANVIKAGLDCSANPNYPTSEKGDMIPVSVSGKIGGAAGKDVRVGDVVVCLADATTNTESVVGSSFIVLENNRSGLVTLYTADVDLKTVADTTIVLPTNLWFVPIEAFLILTDTDTVTGQPTIRFGNTNSLAALKAAAATSGLTAEGHRHRVTTFDTNTAQDSTYDLSAGVTVAATGTTVTGRFGFVGYYIPKTA